MKGFSWTIGACVVIGWSGLCAAAAPSATKPPGCALQAADHLGSLADAADAIACNAAGHRLLIVGELHGTKESPELVRMLIDTAAKSRPVRLGLEMPSSGQTTLELFLHSSGTADDQAKLLQSPFWAGDDGRSSMAWLQLIKHARELRSAGVDVDIFAMEPDYSSKAVEKQGFMVIKEAGMARSIRRVLVAGAPDSWVIALMGNVHARYGDSLQGMSVPTPSVTERLADLTPYVVLPAARQTAAWNCTAEGCGVHDFTSTSAPKAQLPAFVKIKSPADATVVRLWLTSMTAALPAKPRPTEASTPPPSR